ncbi:citrate lyase acyl carrier protein [Fructilactobacillus lindneri]|uniref:Citrate lyase acyl carrier protein n=2 Tax=Fructilactobacillus lindneri TaxID=53444 RepID=A0A0R2JM23_9LACO|nr:citrate lyase acyl carrier protein [Fructilactobacillus lindneri]ANZ57558.1 citrate lyase ACP [Fructilactobacillus lindneri]ANZ58827.1 citrate lyase ACP [Fructilactobacillus lindneri]KRN78256.1 citrate lyase subunit gamma [Fructilactobacillus lindneri DSM 20690 = JCM 11027]POG97680.1 citrate lyase acyl carrier protein [Fructilactobacillus lindneri]POH00067.1 citrate lyase acyl carrier protein [Fructilactobacillus lindneri]
MEIKKTAMDGTLESSDIQITVSKGTNGVNIDLTSDVKERFGDDIIATIKKVASDFQLDNVNIKAVDQGALDCVIKARAITAIQRALGNSEEPAWEAL